MADYKRMLGVSLDTLYNYKSTMLACEPRDASLQAISGNV
jgi:hypothetical protein